MGIPVVQLDTPWSVNVMQRIPLNLDRDNVSPTYARKVHAALLNAMQDGLDGIDPDAPWVREAAGAPEVSPDAFVAVLNARFGENRVMVDPSDREAGHRAVASDHRVVHGNQLNAGEREVLKRLRSEGIDPLVPAGQTKFKTPKPYGDGPGVAKVIPEDEWTPRMREVVAYAKHVHGLLMGDTTAPLRVRIVHTTNGFAACYERLEPRMDLNLFRLGHAWFDETDAGALERVNDLLIHEYGHHSESNHLSAAYYKALTKLGAKLTRCALERTLRPGDFGFELGGGR